MFCCPELMNVRSDVTKWRLAFLLWKKPEEKLSKMADVQVKNDHWFWTLFVTLEEKKLL